jgi:hypothetical protein
MMGIQHGALAARQRLGAGLHSNNFFSAAARIVAAAAIQQD